MTFFLLKKAIEIKMTTKYWHNSSFLPRDKDQDRKNGKNCAELYTGGGWYNKCGRAHLTGQHTKTRSRKDANKQIYYHQGGDRAHPSNSFESWKEALMLLEAIGTNG